ncbi:MAG: class I poly(R)-hydroxyalkanoic acid synthase [Alphaproteobacteria bacterium]|nr:class I poly(R)-hydroxyalkanoic acid synthase [Alphaproteobacteria bacterium]
MTQRKSPSESHHTASASALDTAELGAIMMSVLNRVQPLVSASLEKAGKALSHDPLDIRNAYIDFMKSLLANPEKMANLQLQYWQNWMAIWENVWKKYQGEPLEDIYKPETGDKRFKSAEWQNNLLFDFIKQSYLMTRQWMDQTIQNTPDMEDGQQDRLRFSARQFADALSPTNFVLTNPDVLRETIRTGGENLVRGFENLLSDMERGQGDLKISTTNYKAFEVGRNLATTPGSVVYQNDLIQLIQYTSTTDKVYARPLLIIPPWINKYYILDMRPENSFVKWLVDQGHTVFMVSWINPDKTYADRTFEDYMQGGILDALTFIEHRTGSTDTNVIGYCIGGTLLTMTLAWMKAQNQDHRIASATFLTTLIDFENAGDLKLFADNKAISFLDDAIQENGVLPGSYLSNTFSALRANDLIWSFVINNYLMGKEPFPFDLLYWNDDSTNMPGVLHLHYLRAMYRDNLLVKPGGMSLAGSALDVRTIDTPAFFLSTREDHIAPWKATYAGARLFSGPVDFTLAASGHIAGVVNPPTGKKYCFWESAHLPEDPKAWMKQAVEKPGSWWTYWQTWIEPFAGEKVEKREIMNAIEPAPGSYVRRQA